MRIPLLLLAALLASPTAHALVVATPSRFDLGSLPLGASWEGDVTVINKGSEPTRVAILATAMEAETLTATPESLELAGGESRTVRVRLALPGNVSGGRHDPRLEVVELPPEMEATTVGRGAVSVPIVFFVRNLKIGNLEVKHTPAGEDSEARILVQNFLDAPVEADVRLRVYDAAGKEVAARDARTERTEANASTSLKVALPLAKLPPGIYVVRGEAAKEGLVSNTWEAPLLLGERRLAVDQATVRVEAGGNVVFTARVSNPGTVPLPGAVTFEFGQRNATSRSVDAQGDMLAPGASATLRANTTLAPGDYVMRARVHWPGGQTQTVDQAFTVKGAAAPPSQTPLPVVVGLAGLALAAMLRRR